MIKRLVANLFDELIVVGVSALILGLIILIMKVIGFKFTEIFLIAIIITLVVNLLYYPILEGTMKKTIGKKIMNIE